MTEKNTKDEIDILSLFSLIGKKINSFFILIINLLISFLNLFFKLLLIIRKKIILLLAALIIGGITGYFYKKTIYQPSYKTTLTLCPNFGSTYKIYENIKYYKSLIDQEDFEKLSYKFGIDTSKAKTIKSISIEPFKTQSSKFSNYQKMLNDADSVTALTLSYGAFEDKIPFDLYKLHVITLELNSKNIPIEIEKTIIESVENNIYFKNKKETFFENLKIKKKYVLASIQKLDTLLFGKEKNLNSENLGTTIVLDKNQNEDTDLQLFDRYTDLRNELVEINFQFKDKENVVNTIDSFNELGVNVSTKNYILYGGLFLFLIMLLVLIFYHIYILNPNLKFKKLDY